MKNPYTRSQPQWVPYLTRSVTGETSFKSSSQLSGSFYVLDLERFFSLFNPLRIIDPVQTTTSLETAMQSHPAISDTLSDTQLRPDLTIRFTLFDESSPGYSSAHQTVATAQFQKGTTTIGSTEFAYEALRFDAKKHMTVVDIDGICQSYESAHPAGNLHIRAGFDMKFLATYALSATATQLDLREQSVGLLATEHLPLVDLTHIRLGKRHCSSTQTLPSRTYLQSNFAQVPVKQGKRTPLGTMKDKVYSFVYKKH
jgi:hypothetical protein